jgi:hypothetical protein
MLGQVIILGSEKECKNASKQKDQRRCAMKKRDDRNNGADLAQGLKVPISKRLRCSAFDPRRRFNSVSSYCGCMLEVLSVRHKAGHFLLRLLPQVRIQSLTNDGRIMQVVLKAVMCKCRSEDILNCMNLL